MSVDTGALLDQAFDSVDSHNARVDNKAGVLCALNLGAVGVIGAGITQTSLPGWEAAAIAAGSIGPLVASTLVALRAFIPDLSGQYGFISYAVADHPDDTIGHVKATEERKALRLSGVSMAVYRKYRRLRTAVALSGAGIVAGAAAGVVVGVSRLL